MNLCLYSKRRPRQTTRRKRVLSELCSSLRSSQASLRSIAGHFVITGNVKISTTLQWTDAVKSSVYATLNFKAGGLGFVTEQQKKAICQSHSLMRDGI